MRENAALRMQFGFQHLNDCLPALRINSIFRPSNKDLRQKTLVYPQSAMDAFAQHRAIGFGAFVVLAGGDVAGAAVVVHLEDVWFLVLSFLSGHAAEIGTDSAVAVVADRIHRVITHSQSS